MFPVSGSGAVYTGGLLPETDNLSYPFVSVCVTFFYVFCTICISNTETLTTDFPQWVSMSISISMSVLSCPELLSKM